MALKVGIVAGKQNTLEPVRIMEDVSWDSLSLQRQEFAQSVYSVRNMPMSEIVVCGRLGICSDGGEESLELTAGYFRFSIKPA